jgi:hypothetical protein
MLIEWGYEPFILIGWRDRRPVELKHSRDEMDEALIGVLIERYAHEEAEEREEWQDSD